MLVPVPAPVPVPVPVPVPASVKSEQVDLTIDFALVLSLCQRRCILCQKCTDNLPSLQLVASSYQIHNTKRRALLRVYTGSFDRIKIIFEKNLLEYTLVRRVVDMHTRAHTHIHAHCTHTDM